MATPMERHAWSLLKNRGVLGLKFRRQRILRGFIVDFFCATEQLVLELEGEAHDDPDRRAYDRARAEVLESAGYRVICVRNRDVTREYLEDLLSFRSPSPHGGEGPGGEDWT